MLVSISGQILFFALQRHGQFSSLKPSPVSFYHRPQFMRKRQMQKITWVVHCCLLGTMQFRGRNIDLLDLRGGRGKCMKH